MRDGSLVRREVGPGFPRPFHSTRVQVCVLQKKGTQPLTFGVAGPTSFSLER